MVVWAQFACMVSAKALKYATSVQIQFAAFVKEKQGEDAKLLRMASYSLTVRFLFSCCVSKIHGICVSLTVHLI